MLACEHPSLVDVPPAANLSWNRYETLVPAMQVYLRDMQAYVSCVRAEIDAAEESRHSFVSLLVARNNAAVTELQAVLGLYEALNAELERLQRARAESQAP